MSGAKVKASDNFRKTLIRKFSKKPHSFLVLELREFDWQRANPLLPEAQL